MSTAPEDLIRSYYRSQTGLKLRPLTEEPFTLCTNYSVGLGDTMTLTDLPVAANKHGLAVNVWSESPHFSTLMGFSPLDQATKDKVLTRSLPEGTKQNIFNVPDASWSWDCGNGHYFQRIRRAFRLPVDDLPKGILSCATQHRENYVAMHFDPGHHAIWQKANIHPKGRDLQSHVKTELEAFIASRPELTFITVGDKDPGIKGTMHRSGLTVAELIEVISSCSWFIGILSGPLHIATALGLRVVTLVNFPAAHTIFLPTLKVLGAAEEEWLPSQSCVLHQGNEDKKQCTEGPLVKLATCENFKKAFDGDLYPFWSTKYLSLIHDA